MLTYYNNYGKLPPSTAIDFSFPHEGHTWVRQYEYFSIDGLRINPYCHFKSVSVSGVYKLY